MDGVLRLLVRRRFLWVILAPLMLSFVAAANAPSIAKQPQSLTVRVGTPAVFAVEAAGEELTYQWSRNGAEIAGATAATFTVPSTALADRASVFEVKIKNDKGTVYSCKAILSVIESGEPSTSPPVCPAPPPSDDGGGCSGRDRGSDGDPGASSGGSTSGGSTSGGSSGSTEPAPYPVTKWKGTVKATTVLSLGNTSYKQTIDGSVTFTSFDGEIGVHPMGISTLEGSLSLVRDGTSADCTEHVEAKGTVQPVDGQISFIPTPPPPQTPSELKYRGSGASTTSGTHTRTCSGGGGTTTTPWLERPAWLVIGAPEPTTRPDLLVISGTYVDATTSPGTTTTYEWHLVKQR
ncbi:MAG: hypothetical protein JNL38_16550 [Myxococcales bacterium]|nr:hypothetical protein [Myxococcales bacterium]